MCTSSCGPRRDVKQSVEVAEEPRAKVCSGEEDAGVCHWGPNLSRARGWTEPKYRLISEATDLTSLAFIGNRNR